MEGLVAICKMKTGCDAHRLVWPLRYMGIDVNQWNGLRLGDVIKTTRLFLFNRNPGFDIHHLAELRKVYGFKIVTDLDDYWELYTNHILYNSWTKNNTAKKIQDSIKLSDEVIVTTSILADKVRPLNKNVHIIPNGIAYDKNQFNDMKIESDKTRFLYCGGSSHFNDLQILKRPFEKVVNNSKFNNSKFILAGIDHTNKDSFNFWSKMERSFALNGRLPGYESRPTLGLESYMNHYSSGDVTLVPLEDNIFNACKSDLKILESAVKYNPCICSDVSPYSEFTNRNIVSYAKNAATWFDHIKKFATDKIFLKEQGQALGEYCREHYNLIKINKYRTQLFEHLIKS